VKIAWLPLLDDNPAEALIDLSQCALGVLNDTAGGNQLGVQAMIQDVRGALWFITLLIVVYGMATGDLCLWRRDD
jgi:hypothetical protein